MERSGENQNGGIDQQKRSCNYLNTLAKPSSKISLQTTNHKCLESLTRAALNRHFPSCTYLKEKKTERKNNTNKVEYP